MNEGVESSLEAALRDAGIDTKTLAGQQDGAKNSLHTLTTTGAKAVALWFRLREVVPQTGHWPVILGPWDAAAFLPFWADRAAQSPSPKRVVRRGLALDAEKWLDA